MTIPDEPERSLLISEFFTAPTKVVGDGATSVLYLIRRELQDCLIGKVVDEDKVLNQPTRHRLFASAMVVFTGVDFLARFVDDNPSHGSRARFVGFLRRFGSISGTRVMNASEAEILWAFRSSLLHSFGLHHVENGRTVPLWIFQQDRPAPVVHKCQLSNGGHGWELSIDDLVEMFLRAIAAFEEELATDDDLQRSFFAALRVYGTLHHRGLHVARKARTAP